MPVEIPKLKAFVLMPFDPEFDIIFNDLIKPAIEDAGYEVKRADSFLNQENILKDIVRGIAEADLVIADLTTLNANVFYELGISHTLRRPTVLLSQSSKDIPFDLKPYRVITYSTHFIDAPQLSQKLKEVGEKAKRGNIGFGNPVTDFLPQLYEVNKSFVTQSENAVATVDEKEVEKGILDFVVESEKSIDEITKCADRISNATKEMGESYQIGTEEVVKINKAGGPGTASRVHKCASDMAKKMIQYSQKLEEELPILHNSWESFDENMYGLIKSSRISSKDDKDAAIKFRSNLEALRSAVRFSLDGMQGYQKVTANMKGISREINRASARMIHVLDLLIAEFEAADSFCLKTLTLLDEKIDKEGKNL